MEKPEFIAAIATVLTLLLSPCLMLWSQRAEENKRSRPFAMPVIDGESPTNAS